MDFTGDVGFWQRRIADGPEGAKRRLAALDAFEVAPGQALLELGCGGGHLVRELALAVGGEGRAVGVDPSEEQIAAARTHCADVPAVELVVGDAADLPFADAAFDGIVAINTLEYIGDTGAALAEARRVLKPGGRLTVLSVLWDHWRYHGADPGLNERIIAAWRSHCHHQMLPIELPPKLGAAGFQGVRRELFTFMNGALHENSYAYAAARVVAAFVPGRDGVGRDDARRWLEQLGAADADGRFGFINVSVLTTATAR